jgi:polyhydroxybutyrate depolymerase
MSYRAPLSLPRVASAAFFVSLTTGCAAAPDSGRSAENDLVIGETQNQPDPDLDPALIERRPYESSAPRDYDGRDALPLIVALHGRGSTGPAFVERLGLLQGVDAHRVLLAYPTGETILGASGWAAMSGIPGMPDDVAYLRAVIADMASRYRIDRERVVVIGLSMGGFMANYLACRASDRVTGIVSIAGSLVAAEEASCVPSRPVSVTLIHGTDDPYVQYQGGPLPMEGVEGSHPSAPDLFGFWGDANGYGETAALPARDLDAVIEGAESAGLRRSGRNGNRSVTLWSVAGGGHLMALSPETIWSVLDEVSAPRAR